MIGIKKSPDCEMNVDINANTIIKENDLLILLGRDDRLCRIQNKFTFVQKED